MPDGPLSVLLDWSEAVGSDCSDAFAVERLRAVLPALVRAFVASHTYSRSERWDSGSDVVELHDAGCGSVVGRVLPLTGLMRWPYTATKAGRSSRRRGPNSPARSPASTS